MRSTDLRFVCAAVGSTFVKIHRSYSENTIISLSMTNYSCFVLPRLLDRFPSSLTGEEFLGEDPGIGGEQVNDLPTEGGGGSCTKYQNIPYNNHMYEIMNQRLKIFLKRKQEKTRHSKMSNVKSHQPWRWLAAAAGASTGAAARRWRRRPRPSS